MNYLLLTLSVLALVLWTVFVNVSHADDLHKQLVELGATVDEDGTVFISDPYEGWLINVCRAKGDVTMFTYKHRDKISQEDALTVLERDWNETWSLQDIEWASYVDMQRIVRDAYRTDSTGEYIRQENRDNYVEREINACLDLYQY